MPNAIDNLLTELETGEDNENETLHQNCRQSDFPGVFTQSHAEADSVSEVSVQAHTRGESHRVIGEKAMMKVARAAESAVATNTAF